jgi:chromosomal replication initiator protein
MDKTLNIPKTIINIVSKKMGVKYSEMCGKSRKKEFVIARHLSMYFIKNNTILTLEKIGLLFNNRDHSAITHAVHKVLKMQEHKDYKLIFMDLDSEIKDTINKKVQQKSVQL